MSNYKRNNNKTKGGFFIHVNDTDVHELNITRARGRTSVDCCMCSLSFMKMPQSQVDRLFLKYGHSGMSEDRIRDLFKDEYNHYDFDFSPIPLNNIDYSGTSSIIQAVFNLIPPVHMAFGGIKRRDNTKHCIVFAKDSDGELYVFDTQIGRGYKGITQIMNNFIIRENITEIFILQSRNKSDGTPYIGESASGEHHMELN